MRDQDIRLFPALSALRTASLLALLILLPLGASAGAQASPQSRPTRQPVAVATSSSSSTSPRQPHLKAPKRSVAVSRFVSKTDFDLQYGLADVGGGLTDLLTSALVESNHFVVVERATLSDLLAEQRLTESGLVVGDGPPVAGDLLGASLLVKGAVTDMNESAGGNGLGIGIAGFGVGVNSRKATVALDIQLIDAASGQVLASFPVRESATARSVGFDVNKRGVNTGYSAFRETTVGEAAAKAVASAVSRLVRAVARQPWTGRVVTFERATLVINAGEASGIRAGDIFAIVRALEAFTDPATGRVLGQRKLPVGRAVVQIVDDEVAFASFEPLTADVVPMRGDLVVLP